VSGYAVGDKVVFAPHGAGVVIATEHRDDAWGEYLSIRIANSTLTLMVPAAAAEEKGVRPILDDKGVKALLTSLAEDPQALPENPQDRARRANERLRSGKTDILAGIVRDYTGLERGGKKLTATEMGALNNAKNTLAAEIALATDIAPDAALERLELALGNELPS